jgi:hypothetical protein
MNAPLLETWRWADQKAGGNLCEITTSLFALSSIFP